MHLLQPMKINTTKKVYRIHEHELSSLMMPNHVLSFKSIELPIDCSRSPFCLALWWYQHFYASLLTRSSMLSENINNMIWGNEVLTTQSRIIGAVRGAHSQLWGTIIAVCSLYAARKYDRRFGTSAIVWFTGKN